SSRRRHTRWPRDWSSDVCSSDLHFFGADKLLRRMLQADRLSSIIFYGPPGTGKTALAHVIAQHTRCRFRQINAVATGVKEVREQIGRASCRERGERTGVWWPGKR